MASNRESVSEQSKRRTNYLLLVFGIVLALLFLLAWCRSKPEVKRPVVEAPTEGFEVDSFNPDEVDSADLPGFSRGAGQLVATPNEVVMSGVIVGSSAEASVIFRAVNGPILLESKNLAEKQEDGFELSGSCMSLERLNKDEECVVNVSWTPKALRNIQNTLTIQWREDSPSVFEKSRTDVRLKAQSTDSTPCVVCESKCDKEEGDPQPVVDSDGIEQIPDKPLDNPVEIEPVIRIREPDKVPLNLKNEVMGTIAKNLDVVDKNGKKIGRLLGDNTVIDPSTGTVIGKAIHLTSAMNEHGHVFGRMVLEGDTLSVVDAKKNVVGYPRVDGQVVDSENNPIGFISPWGVVVDFAGNFFGLALPNGSVVRGKNEVVAGMRPMGFAVNDKGELVGATVPRGVPVGAGGRSLGKVGLNGEVKDSFDQVIGHVLMDGSVVDADMNELGSVIRQGVIINNAGKPIGFVNSEGKALNFKATQIGTMNPDGTAFAYKKFVGTLMPEGQITKGACGTVGSVYPDGNVVDLSLKSLGYITPTGKAVDSKKRELGVVVPWGTAIAPGCRLLGLISLNGSVVSTDGVKTGCVGTDKTVQNLQGQSVGEVTPFGLYVNDKKQVIGRVRPDGQIMDNKGQVVGCVYEKQLPFSGFSTKGIIVDENGYPLGGTTIGNKAYDEHGAWIGDVYFNGWVIGEKGQLKGAIPFSGVVFSDDGKVVGTYDQQTGALVNAAGANLGRVLPGFTVINQGETEILGKLIPEKTPFMQQDGSFLGMLNSDGQLVGSDVSGSFVIHADGSVTDSEGHLIGGKIPMGPVLSANGKYMGIVNHRGEVIDNHQMKIGHVLLNGVAISDKNQVLGQVFPSLSIGISSHGFLGSVEPKVTGAIGSSAYELQVNDAKGNRVGGVSGTGVILAGEAVSGRLLPVAPFVNSEGKLLGWMNFEGGMNTPDGHSSMTILPSGTVWNASQNWEGALVYEGVAVDTTGAYLGRIGMRGEILSDKGERIAVVNGNSFLYNTNGAIVGQILKPGIAVDLNNQPMGWTRFDGQIENGANVLGSVGLDGHVFDGNGQMIGRYLAFGTQAFNDAEKSVGFLGDLGEFVDVSGLILAGMGHEPYVAAKGSIIGREMAADGFVTSLESGRVLGLVSETGSVTQFSGDKSVGSVMTNGEFVGTSHRVEGGLVSQGLAVMPTLGLIGSVGLDGQVYKAGKKVATTTGAGLVYSTGGELIGGIFKPSVLIDKRGVFAGTTSGTPGIFKNTQQIGNKLAFRSALSTDNAWIGNVMPEGGVVDAYGQYYGVVASSDGTVVALDNAFGGRVLPDGSVVGVPEKAVFNTMPYAGHTVPQGIPVGLNQQFNVIGTTTSMGDVMDDSGKKLYRITDNGYVMNKAGQSPPVVAQIVPFMSVIDNDGNVMGTSSADGTVVSFTGEKKGRLDNAGRVRSSDASSKIDKLRTQGFVVPEGLVVNDCKIVGQTAYDGRVINGQGIVVGRLQRDLWAVDANGTKIGRVVRNNEPCMTKDRQYLGRTLPDSTVVDLNGVEIGCATNSGEMLDFKGNALCKIVERAPFFDQHGKMLGILLPDGTGWNGIEQIGISDSEGVMYNEKGEPFAWVHQEESLFFDEKGNLEFGQKVNDVVSSPSGVDLYRVPPIGPITDIDGNPLPSILPHIPNLGYLQGCDLFRYDGEKIASLKANGTFRDDHGNLVYKVSPDGQIYAPDGTFVETFRGLDVGTALKQCGISDASHPIGGRKIQIGDHIYDVEGSSILDDEGKIIMYLADDGRPYYLDGRPVITEEKVIRTPPDVTPKFKPTPAQIDEFQEKLTQKRKGMKAQMGRGILTISAEMKARAKPKKDKDWEKLGFGRTRENTSTWPVDMSHVILEGKAIPAVLARSIDSRYATSVPAVAIVEANIYGEEGRNILIPAGSRLIGQVAGSGDQQNGVAKLQIVWQRLIRPDGSAFNLTDAQSGDAQGRGGVAAYLDEQLWNKYGTSILGVLAQSSVAYMMATNDDVSATTASGGTSTQTNRSQAANDARQAFIDEIGEILDDMIERAKQTPPVVFIPAGTRLTVFPKTDLWLRSVEDDEQEANEEFGEPSSFAQTAKVSSWTEKRKSEQSERTSLDQLQDSSEKPRKETEKPLYDGTSTMPDISDRKVEPVSPQEEILSN